MDCNLYDINQCKAAIQSISNIKITIATKAEHKTKVYEIKNTLETMMNINRHIFNPDYNFEFCNYYDAVNLWYKERTKTQLDNALRLTLHTIKSTLFELIDMEYQTRDGRLVPDTRGGIHAGQWIEPERLESIA